MHLTIFVNDVGWPRVSISNRCVLTRQIILFGKFLDPDFDLTALLGYKGRADTVDGASKAFSFPVMSRPR